MKHAKRQRKPKESSGALKENWNEKSNGSSTSNGRRNVKNATSAVAAMTGRDCGIATGIVEVHLTATATQMAGEIAPNLVLLQRKDHIPLHWTRKHSSKLLWSCCSTKASSLQQSRRKSLPSISSTQRR